MSVATITSKGQITIPKEIRALLDLKAGDKVNFISVEDGNVRFIPVKKNVTSLKGSVPKPAKPVSIDDMNDTIKKMGSDS